MAETPTPKQQSAADKAEIKIRLIDNGFLIGRGASWSAFETWPKARVHIENQISMLRSKPQEKVGQ